MVQYSQRPDQRELQKLRDAIVERGWQASVDFIIREIEFVTDLCAHRMLPIIEIETFGEETQVTVNVLRELRYGHHEEEPRRLREAWRAFNRHAKDFLCSAPSSNDKEHWSLPEARASCDHLDHTLRLREVL